MKTFPYEEHALSGPLILCFSCNISCQLIRSPLFCIFTIKSIPLWTMKLDLLAFHCLLLELLFLMILHPCWHLLAGLEAVSVKAYTYSISTWLNFLRILFFLSSSLLKLYGERYLNKWKLQLQIQGAIKNSNGCCPEHHHPKMCRNQDLDCCCLVSITSWN